MYYLHIPHGSLISGFPGLLHLVATVWRHNEFFVSSIGECAAFETSVVKWMFIVISTSATGTIDFARSSPLNVQL